MRGAGRSRAGGHRSGQPLGLSMPRAWDIDQGEIDTAAFFELLPKCFPDATTLFLEGTSIARDVKHRLSGHAEKGPHLPGRQTLWPLSTRLRYRFSLSLCAELEAMAKCHAQPELCDHLSLYRDEEELLGFHDFGANNIYVSGTIPEPAVSAFANGLGLAYRRVE